MPTTVQVQSGGNVNNGWSLNLEGVLDRPNNKFDIQAISITATVNGHPNTVVYAWLPAAIPLPSDFVSNNNQLQWPGGTPPPTTLRLRDEALRRLQNVELAWNLDGAGGAGTA